MKINFEREDFYRQGAKVAKGRGGRIAEALNLKFEIRNEEEELEVIGEEEKRSLISSH